ncbi:MAG: GDSL-type esterase/lipase family protein [Cyanobacteria bacterium P01_F01_bin.150]
MSSSFYHRRRSAIRSKEFSVRPPRRYSFSPWFFVSVLLNVVLAGLVGLSLRDRPFFSFFSAFATANEAIPYEQTPPSQWIDSNQGEDTNDFQDNPRHKWNYDEWVSQLEREAGAVAGTAPENLNILLGDSISLWFPHELLPNGSTWLNQGISGEGTVGLINRLGLISETKPKIIYLMIGINDLLRNVSDETLLANQQQIIQDLQEMHPEATIVVQTILPHAGDRITWEGKESLLAISNERIQSLNQRLRDIAETSNVEYLDLQPMFRDSNGNLRVDLTTDGLHLNDDGYRVWASALQMHSTLALDIE